MRAGMWVLRAVVTPAHPSCIVAQVWYPHPKSRHKPAVVILHTASSNRVQRTVLYSFSHLCLFRNQTQWCSGTTPISIFSGGLPVVLGWLYVIVRSTLDLLPEMYVLQSTELFFWPTFFFSLHHQVPGKEAKRLALEIGFAVPCTFSRAANTLTSYSLKSEDPWEISLAAWT